MSALATPEAIFQQYCDSLPTQEDRWQLARQLADPARPVPEKYLPMQSTLACHWPYTVKRLRSLVEYMYELTHRVEAHQGESSIIEKENRRSGNSELLIGKIGGRIVHHYNGNLSDNGPARQGIRPPYVAVGLSIQTYEQQRIVASSAGWSSEQLAGGDMFLYLATISLADATIPAVEKRSMVIGNTSSFDTIREKSLEAPLETCEAILKLRRENILGPDKPLPNFGLALSGAEATA